MKRFLLIVLIVISISGLVYAGNPLTLADDTDVSDVPMRNCLATEHRKNLVVEGDSGDTFAVYCNGTLPYTITLETASGDCNSGASYCETWGFSERCYSFKVDMSANGNEVANLYCQ